MATATLLALEGLPAIFGPLAGSIIDRGNKRHLMISCDIARGALLIALFVSCRGRNLSLNWLYAVAVLSSTLGLLYTPLLRIVLPSLVHDKQLSAANAAIQAGQQFAMILGSALAGVSLATLGAPLALLIDGITFVIAAIAILNIRFPLDPPGSIKATSMPIVRDIAEGISFIMSTPELLLMISVLFFGNLILSPVNVIFPIFSQQVLMQGVRGFGFLATGITIGLLIGALIAGFVGERFSFSWAVLLGLIGMSASLAGLSTVKNIWEATAIVTLLGVFAPLVQVPFVARLQRIVPKAFQGRTFATMSSLVSIALPLGAALFGRALVAVKITHVIRFASGGCLLVAFIWWAGGMRRKTRVGVQDVPTE